MDRHIRFNDKIVVHRLIVWDYAARAARRGEWEQHARDRARFKCRIERLERIIAPVLKYK
jgi:hypothetical protein